jgi:hypothetical protein
MFGVQVHFPQKVSRVLWAGEQEKDPPLHMQNAVSLLGSERQHLHGEAENRPFYTHSCPVCLQRVQLP